jgi:hypothetical protein
MLYLLATTPDNDANIAQLIMAIAPAIYKPLDTCYMSIRHTELLKHIRPILQFITEHHAEILRSVGPSKYQTTSTEAATPCTITERLQQLQKISSSGVNVPKIPISVPSIPSPASSFPSKSSSSLSLHVHSTMEVEGADNVTPYPEDLLNLSTHIAAHPPNYHSQEWKILEVLANSRLDLWLRQGYIGSNSLWDTDLGSHRTPQSTSRRNADDLRLYDSDDEESSAKEGRSKREPSQHKRGRGGDSRRGDERRALVAECKSLRHEVGSSLHQPCSSSDRRQIQNYEERMKYENKKISVACLSLPLSLCLSDAP